MRLDGLMHWVESLSRPKHIVLTFRNVPRLTAQYVKKCKSALTRFRRRKLMAGISAGFWAMEITNKGKGWHLHFHLVVEAPFIDVRLMSAVWADVTGDGSEVVWIEDASKGGLRQNLPRYVTKYCGKGFRPHDWTPEQLGEFVDSVADGRTFGVFGALMGHRKEWAEWLKTVRVSRRKCECGCSSKKYYSDAEFEWHTHFTGFSRGSRPPPSTPICVDMLDLDYGAVAAKRMLPPR
jgi:hypothetical protein